MLSCHITSHDVTLSYHIISHSFERHEIIRYNTAVEHVTLHTFPSYSIISHDISSQHSTSHHITSYHMTSHHVTLLLISILTGRKDTSRQRHCAESALSRVPAHRKRSGLAQVAEGESCIAVKLTRGSHCCVFVLKVIDGHIVTPPLLLYPIL